MSEDMTTALGQLRRHVAEELADWDGRSRLTEFAAWAELVVGGDAGETGGLLGVWKRWSVPEKGARQRAANARRYRLAKELERLPEGDAERAAAVHAIAEAYGFDGGYKSVMNQYRKIFGRRRIYRRMDRYRVRDWIRCNMAVGEERQVRELAEVLGWEPRNVVPRVVDLVGQGVFRELIELRRGRLRQRQGKDAWLMRRIA